MILSILLRKLSLWAAFVGVILVIYLVRETTAIEPMPELAFPAVQKPSARVIAAAGIVEALHENTSIGVPTAALVQQVFVKVWDEVKAGTPMLRLDDRELQAQLNSQRAEIRVSEAELAKARHQHERAESLRASQGVSQDEADTRRDEFALAQARVESARATAAETEALIERLIVRTPIDGTILQINTRAGEYVSLSSDAPPLLLGSIEEVQVRADVDEQVAPRVKAGSRAIGYLKGDTQNAVALEFVRIEPFVIPKRNLTGSSSERVDTRVLQIIYKMPNEPARRVYVGQQMDLFIEE